jgi:hypothetical protein
VIPDAFMLELESTGIAKPFYTVLEHFDLSGDAVGPIFP